MRSSREQRRSYTQHDGSRRRQWGTIKPFERAIKVIRGEESYYRCNGGVLKTFYFSGPQIATKSS